MITDESRSTETNGRVEESKALDLTEQFILDFETYRGQVDSKVVEALRRDVAALEKTRAELTLRLEDLRKSEAALKDGVRGLEEDLATDRKALSQLGETNQTLQASLKTAQDASKKHLDLYNGTMTRIQELELEIARLKARPTEPAPDSEALVRKLKKLESELQNVKRAAEKRLETEKRNHEDQMALSKQSYGELLEKTRRTLDGRSSWVRDLNRRVMRAAAAPLSLRVLAMVLDLIVSAIVASLLVSRFPELSNPGRMLLAWCVVFSLRAFVSPGNLAVGLSVVHVDADPRKTCRAGLLSRCFCGLLHYGPLIATATADLPTGAARRTVATLPGLIASAATGGPAIGPELERISSSIRTEDWLSMVLLLATGIWWGFLVLSILWSPLIYRSVPYLIHTTIIESLARVGFRRFKPPVLEVPEDEVAMDEVIEATTTKGEARA